MAPSLCGRKVGDRVFDDVHDQNAELATCRNYGINRENPKKVYRDIAAKMLDNVNNVKEAACTAPECGKPPHIAKAH